MDHPDHLLDPDDDRPIQSIFKRPDAVSQESKVVTLVVGAVPVLIITAIIGPKTALGGGVGTTFLSVGNAFTFGGLLATLPGQERFDEFKRSLGI